jgi:hypothetical protein
MKCSQRLIVVSAGFLLLRAVPSLCSSFITVEELERNAITYRLENVKQGYVRIHVIDYEPSERRLERLYEVTFDQNRVRQIRRLRNIGDLEWGDPEKIVVTPKIYIDDIEFIDTAVSVVPATRYKNPRTLSRVLNVQALGMDSGGVNLLHIAHVESLLNRADRIGPTVHDEQRNGMDTWRIDYRLKIENQKTEPSIALWIAPSQGFGVVGIEVRFERNGKHYKTVIDSQLKKYPLGEIWYPSKVVRLVKKEDEVQSHQVILVEEARFGHQIDDAAFSLGGLDLKPGREAVDSTVDKPRAKIWDGEKLVDPSCVPAATPSNPVRNRRPRWLQLTLAVVLGLTAAVYFWRAFKKQRSASNPGA